MTFQLVYYSQQDAQWKGDILGFGDPGDTIGYIGCALTSVAMLLSGHGLIETPKTLNQKLKNASGFSGAGIRWGAVNQIYPQVVIKSNVSCINIDAPLGLIDASIAAGQPAIVMVDSTPATGLLTHWVVLYGKEGDDYLMLDPWPYQTDVKKKTYLMPRYSQGNPLKRSIMHVILYESFNASGGIASPSDGTSTGTPPPTVTSAAQPEPSANASYARVKADVTWGLNIRSSIDTSTTANIIVSVPAGTLLTIIEADGMAKLGAVNQWVRVLDNKGREGFAAAWYLEKYQTAVSAAQPIPAQSPATTGPVSSSSSSTPLPTAEPKKLIVAVKSAGSKVFSASSRRSEVISKEKGGAKLVVVEPIDKALSKIGVGGKWLTVKGSNGKRGYIDGGTVKET